VIDASEGGPALASGIDRGTDLLHIGSQTGNALMATGVSCAVIDDLVPGTGGHSDTVTTRDPSVTQRTITLAKAGFDIDPVSDRYGARVLVDGARRVGYLQLRIFVDTSEADLRAAFADFKAQGDSELIVDLRYNGGGLIT